MPPNSADSTLEKLLAWPLDIKMLVYKLMCTKHLVVFLVVAEREKENDTNVHYRKMAKELQPMYPVEYCEVIETRVRSVATDMGKGVHMV